MKSVKIRHLELKFEMDAKPGANCLNINGGGGDLGDKGLDKLIDLLREFRTARRKHLEWSARQDAEIAAKEAAGAIAKKAKVSP